MYAKSYGNDIFHVIMRADLLEENSFVSYFSYYFHSVIHCFKLCVWFAFMHFKPFHNNNVHIVSGWFSKMAVLGVKLELTYHDAKNVGPAVYVANHQNNYDLFTLPAMVPENCVSLGKKSLKWIPFFGQLYWLIGKYFN